MKITLRRIEVTLATTAIILFLSGLAGKGATTAIETVDYLFNLGIVSETEIEEVQKNDQ